MNKLELIQALKESQNLSKTETTKCVDIFFGEMAKTITKT
ncbi:HU family DNA-binding protein [Desulfatitalea tepidiphila]|nr:HU family DNA-binding protein [Desulfatitalea tepidiphila]